MIQGYRTPAVEKELGSFLDVVTPKKNIKGQGHL